MWIRCQQSCIYTITIPILSPPSWHRRSASVPRRAAPCNDAEGFLARGAVRRIIGAPYNDAPTLSFICHLFHSDADLFLLWRNDATALRTNPHPAVMALAHSQQEYRKRFGASGAHQWACAWLPSISLVMVLTHTIRNRCAVCAMMAESLSCIMRTGRIAYTYPLIRICVSMP